MPDLELSGQIQNGEHSRCAAHEQHDHEQGSAAIKTFRECAEKNPEETHRK
jgi:hypothetical protein